MAARLLDGKAIAQQIREEVRQEAAALTEQGRRPGLGVLLVGDDPASAIYVRSKTRACEELGLLHQTRHLPADASQARVFEEIDAYNRQNDVHGLLVQLPLPPQIDAAQALLRVEPAKDIDCFHPLNVGLLVQKRPRFVACTPAGVMELLQRSDIPIAGRHAVVVGRSDIVGKPMALLLLHANATVTVCHSRTTDLAAVTGQADILVAAIGRPGFIRAEHVKPGAVVIDVGQNKIEDNKLARELLPPERLPAFQRNGYALVGDVHFPAVRELAGALTPVPGGVGPLTIAMLVKNTVTAASRCM